MVILDVLSDILVGVAVGSSTIVDTFSMIVTVIDDPSSMGASTVEILDVLSDILVGVAVGSSITVDTFSVIVISPLNVCAVSDVEPDVCDGMFSVVARLSEDVVSAEVTGEGSNVEAGDGVTSSVVGGGDAASSEVGTDVWLVVSGGLGGGDDVVGIVGDGAVMIMSSGQVGLLPKKVTSARNTQSEPGESLNRIISTGIVVTGDKHTRTKEVLDVIPTLASCIRALLFSSACIVCTPIPSSGQLNITTSTLSTLLKVGVFMSTVISMLGAVVCIVSS